MRLAKRQVARAYGYFRLYGPRRFIWALAFKSRHFYTRIWRKLFAKEQYWMFGDSFVSSIPLSEGTLPFETFLKSAGVDLDANIEAQDFARSPFIAIIADLSLPQCKKYRVLQKVESLRAIGIACDYADYRDLHRSHNLLQLASFVIFYRVSAGQVFNILKDECSRLKIITAYDIDDPIFAKEIYAKNINLDYLLPHERSSLIENSENYLTAMKTCDHVILSTPRLVEEVKALGINKTFLWRNAVDQETLIAAQNCRLNRKTAKSYDRVRVIYSSGSRAHEADFRIVEDTLLNIMTEYEQLELHVLGYLKLPVGFKQFGKRITITPFGQYDEYMQHLSKADISIVPLVLDDFNDCKSAIRFYEASLVDTVTIASNIGDFSNLIGNGRDGLLASSAGEWAQQLKILLDSPVKRQELAHNARVKVQTSQMGENIVLSLDAKLMDILKAQVK
jgi:glycosyltransferase involved in cell wall biosynthesis